MVDKFNFLCDFLKFLCTFCRFAPLNITTSFIYVYTRARVCARARGYVPLRYKTVVANIGCGHSLRSGFAYTVADGSRSKSPFKFLKRKNLPYGDKFQSFTYLLYSFFIFVPKTATLAKKLFFCKKTILSRKNFTCVPFHAFCRRKRLSR